MSTLPADLTSEDDTSNDKRSKSSEVIEVQNASNKDSEKKPISVDQKSDTVAATIPVNTWPRCEKYKDFDYDPAPNIDQTKFEKYQLKIKNFQATDVGVYSVMAKKEGCCERKSCASIKIIEKQTEKEIKITIISAEFDPPSVNVGETATLLVKVRGPVNKVELYKKNEQGRDKKQKTKTKTEDHKKGEHKLELSNVQHSSEYLVKVSNQNGFDGAIVHIKVNPRENSNEVTNIHTDAVGRGQTSVGTSTAQIQSNTILKQLKNVDVSEGDDSVVTVNTNEPIKDTKLSVKTGLEIVKTLRDQVIVMGESLFLHVTIIGNPTSVTWEKDDIPIDCSERITMKKVHESMISPFEKVIPPMLDFDVYMKHPIFNEWLDSVVKLHDLYHQENSSRYFNSGDPDGITQLLLDTMYGSISTNEEYEADQLQHVASLVRQIIRLFESRQTDTRIRWTMLSAFNVIEERHVAAEIPVFVVENSASTKYIVTTTGSIFDTSQEVLENICNCINGGVLHSKELMNQSDNSDDKVILEYTESSRSLPSPVSRVRRFSCVRALVRNLRTLNCMKATISKDTWLPIDPHFLQTVGFILDRKYRVGSGFSAADAQRILLVIADFARQIDPNQATETEIRGLLNDLVYSRLMQRILELPRDFEESDAYHQLNLLLTGNNDDLQKAFACLEAIEDLDEFLLLSSRIVRKGDRSGIVFFDERMMEINGSLTISAEFYNTIGKYPATDMDKTSRREALFKATEVAREFLDSMKEYEEHWKQKEICVCEKKCYEDRAEEESPAVCVCEKKCFEKYTYYANCAREELSACVGQTKCYEESAEEELPTLYRAALEIGDRLYACTRGKAMNVSDGHYEKVMQNSALAALVKKILPKAKKCFSYVHPFCRSQNERLSFKYDEMQVANKMRLLGLGELDDILVAETEIFYGMRSGDFDRLRRLFDECTDENIKESIKLCESKNYDASSDSMSLFEYVETPNDFACVIELVMMNLRYSDILKTIEEVKNVRPTHKWSSFLSKVYHYQKHKNEHKEDGKPCTPEDFFGIYAEQIFSEENKFKGVRLFGQFGGRLDVYIRKLATRTHYGFMRLNKKNQWIVCSHHIKD